MTATSDPMLPIPYRIHKMRRELADTFTVDLVPESGTHSLNYAPGQFNMVYMFGAGEVPISISGDPAEELPLVHTIRAVGPVTRAMQGLKRGDTLGIRGPFGSAWPVVEAEGSDVVIVTGGVGLAPLRPAIYHILAHREKYGDVRIYYGARTPEDILFLKELQEWRGRFDLIVEVTVDSAVGFWAGRVGVVTHLVSRGRYDPVDTVALVCGPEIMMRYTIKALNERGVGNEQIYVSMERNMKCAIGFCGHCQFGPYFVCKDGPVFRFDQIASIFELREL
ncbi:MAG: FAD/NAD(P)-binding protein [Candidatus Competibacteraceae bacterium]|jgi:NAD(P)H-flavin reductase|nr:FAD/NAD(P)-binding protein [Candidatus Competibacteraceae bacterium]